jgi:phosphatidylglycerophosphate synthase
MTLTPNHITYARMAVVPLITLFLAIDGRFFITLALILFVLAAISDWYDGYLARRMGATSMLGRVFDSIADKLLVAGCLLGLAYNGRLGSGLIIPALAILLREIAVAGLREYVFQRQLAAAQNDDDLNVPATSSKEILTSTQLAKIKTTVQLVGIGILIPAPYIWHPYFGIFGGFVFWVAAALSLYTAWDYWKEAKPYLAQQIS